MVPHEGGARVGPVGMGIVNNNNNNKFIKRKEIFHIQ